MNKMDPIIAVKDVVDSSKWYQELLNCKSTHGGTEFDILVSEKGNVLLCLHKWDAHEHPTMINSNITPGNGLILYFRTDNMESVRQQAGILKCEIEKDIQLNPNSGKREFSLRDPDGYYLTISEYHEYQG